HFEGLADEELVLLASANGLGVVVERTDDLGHGRRLLLALLAEGQLPQDGGDARNTAGVSGRRSGAGGGILLVVLVVEVVGHLVVSLTGDRSALIWLMLSEVAMCCCCGGCGDRRAACWCGRRR